MSTIQFTTLENGLRVITDTVPSVQSVALGIWTAVGTRDEDPQHNGAAHMVEHMLFKGTKTRSPLQIAAEIENVGGHVNAYTSREITSYHVHLLKDDAKLALEILADMYQNSTLPDEEVERERHVILQEIGMAQDTPDDLVFDHYYETAFQGQMIGAPILGTAKHIQSMPREALADHVRRHYTPDRTILSAAGSVQHDEFVDMVRENFQNLPEAQPHSKAPASYTGGEFRLAKDLEQSHIVLGFQGVGRTAENYYTVQALSALLGGGMSSRLFQEIREKRGLVYSIYSFHSGYSDDGIFGVYAGTGPQDLPELIPVVCDEIIGFADTLTDEEIRRARAQLKASVLMGRESMMTRADQHAKHLIFRDTVFSQDELIARIDRIDRAAIQEAARSIFATTPTLAALGPLGALESYDRICGRLAA